MKFKVQAVSIALVLFPGIGATAPLSCQMKGALVTAAAKLRDAGSTRTEIQKVFSNGGELTQGEINAVLNVTYNSGMKNISPEKMGEMTYAVCIDVNK